MSTRRVRRSVLFVPAVRPDRFGKAVATGADAVCLDLEDGVAFGQKDEARDKAMALLAERPPCRAEVILRVNEPASALGDRDLAAVLAAGVRPDALMVPKVGEPDTIRALERRLAPALEGLPLVVQIETARGLAAAEAIATASPNVAVLFFGAVDLAAELGLCHRVGRVAVRAVPGRGGGGAGRGRCDGHAVYGRVGDGAAG